MGGSLRYSVCDIYLDHKIFGSGFKSLEKYAETNKYDFVNSTKKYDLDLKHTGM